MKDPTPGSDPPDDLRSATLPRTAAPLDVPLIELTVEVEGGEAAGRTVVLEGDLLRIGSHPSNDLVLDDPAVSRFHCRLTRGPRAWAVTDTGSLNGTEVNGVRVRDADVGMPECRLQVGDSRLALRDAGSRRSSAPSLAVTFGALIGASLSMRRLFDAIVRVAPTEATVLVLGESGNRQGADHP